MCSNPSVNDSSLAVNVKVHEGKTFLLLSFRQSLNVTFQFDTILRGVGKIFPS